MLGMQDFWVSAAWVLSVASTLGCIIFGALHWHYEEE